LRNLDNTLGNTGIDHSTWIAARAIEWQQDVDYYYCYSYNIMKASAETGRYEYYTKRISTGNEGEKMKK